MQEMTFEQLDGFQKWYAEDPEKRSLQIRFQDGRFTVWVYDYELEVGQFAESAKDINLLDHFRSRALASYKRAQELLRNKGDRIE